MNVYVISALFYIDITACVNVCVSLFGCAFVDPCANVSVCLCFVCVYVLLSLCVWLSGCECR